VRTNRRPALQTQLRTIEIEGKPWFCGVDALQCLGLKVRKELGTITSSWGMTN
tara:strand:- start:3605 stop:3763 length:159 start_codon:yes stop_codon:yes gene_type:complete